MKIKAIAATLIAAHVSLFTLPALADPSTTVAIPLTVPTVSQTDVDVGAALSPLKKSQPATFTGVLLSPAAVAAIIAELNSTKDLVKIEVDKARADEQAHVTFQVNEVKSQADANQKIAQAQLDARGKEIDMLTTQLKKAEDNKSNTPLWAGLGFGAGVVVTVLAVVVVSRASK